jgi:hypothetical protein
MAEARGNRSASSAVEKLEQLYRTLPSDEQAVISDLVRAALIQTADPRMQELPPAESSDDYVAALTVQAAPELVKSIAERNPAAALRPYATWGC